MVIRELDLPGIGKKFEMEVNGGDKIVVIVHDDGRRELYHFYNGEEDSASMVSMEDAEARLLAGIIGGMAYSPKSLENIEVVLGGLVIEWYKVEDGFACIGKTITEMNIRKLTGITILAVIEKNCERNINPGPDYQFTHDSTLIVMGERKNLKIFKNYIRDGRL
ncbi:cation:proton antiporter regulatory subunit [Ruminiclostridium papyrosolvens]|uniref:Potassium transporter n=1 Tax=Ruminiclostridium papyrosolvens C7 TaxID=1330534 RepID=U4R2M5_9FIRM|nr:cation:proton antiporter regulatory subunit [Ruminiclostridium papyrosolvens]EPR12592.1 potassium transporter [Ruminiclostridium papyrosolvens C7]